MAPIDAEIIVNGMKSIAENEGLSLPDEVARYIATCGDEHSTMARLMRVIAYASLSRREIDIELAHLVLDAYQGDLAHS